jgi:4-diphosphocytidyl-2-C-methyl-D-erythritol kinase
MRVLSIMAPAKVNLHLRVKERRPDGFHELESVFLALNFGDSLRFEPFKQENALEIRMEGSQSGAFAPSPAGTGFPIENNIIYKAVSLFRKRTGFLRGLLVTVEKDIPLGGGLGGGSSDGASTLLAMNVLAAAEGRSLDESSLAELAASLGSDVPFFLCKTGAAWVSGRGEQVKPVNAPEGLFFVLVNPGFASDTAAAFRLLDETRAKSSLFLDTPREKNANSFQKKDNESALISFLASDPASWPFQNDFLPVFLQADTGNSGAAAVYRRILSQLREAGAAFCGLSGTGATCFGVFTREIDAQNAMAFLSKLFYLTIATYPLANEAKPVVE